MMDDQGEAGNASGREVSVFGKTVNADGKENAADDVIEQIE